MVSVSNEWRLICPRRVYNLARAKPFKSFKGNVECNVHHLYTSFDSYIQLLVSLSIHAPQYLNPNTMNVNLMDNHTLHNGFAEICHSYDWVIRAPSGKFIGNFCNNRILPCFSRLDEQDFCSALKDTRLKLSPQNPRPRFRLFISSREFRCGQT